MDHTFVKTSEADTCGKCKYPELTHSKTEAVCECCDNVGEVFLRYGNMLMCAVCWEKEQKITAEHMSPENQKLRLDAYLAHSKAIDEKVIVKTDLFNAATIPAIELKAAIQADDSIPIDQKDFLYARTCLERFVHFKKVVFEDREALLKKENEMRAWQIQVRTVANQLSADLREQFKAADLTYQPTPPKTIKPSTKTPKKFQKEEVNSMAAKYKVPAQAVQMLVVAKNMTPEDAAKFLVKAGGGLK